MISIKLWLRLWVLCLAILPAWSAEPGARYKDVGVDEFERLAKTGNPVVLDVRTASEFAAGHLPGAINLDFRGRDFGKRLGALDTNKVYLVYCASGGRSAKACGDMGRRNFTKLYNLLGGFRAWEKAGKASAK